MTKKIGANEPCPCGSGRKYKKCCRDKEFDNLIDQFKSDFHGARIKHCLHPNLYECSDKIIRAHSIQNSKILRRISNNGDLIMAIPRPNSPYLAMVPWGRGQASVFTGFCGYHDTVVFEAIENHDFDYSQRHIFLYIYRAYAYFLHKTMEAANLYNVAVKRDPSFSRRNASFDGLSMAENDLKVIKPRFDSALLNNDFDILSSVVWEFPAAMFAATALEAPTKDLLGNELQTMTDTNSIPRHIFYSIFPEGEKTYCIIAWLKEDDTLFDKYRKQLDGLNYDQRKNYINNTVPITTENLALNPLVWESWSEAQKQEFKELYWGMPEMMEFLEDDFYDRLVAPSFDLFAT